MRKRPGRQAQDPTGTPKPMRQRPSQKAQNPQPEKSPMPMELRVGKTQAVEIQGQAKSSPGDTTRSREFWPSIRIQRNINCSYVPKFSPTLVRNIFLDLCAHTLRTNRFRPIWCVKKSYAPTRNLVARGTYISGGQCGAPLSAA